MKKDKFKYFLTFIVLFMGVVPVLADTNNTVDFSRNGTISITLSEEIENTKVSGAEITIYKVADAIAENSNLKFSYDESLNACQEELNNGNITNEVLECVINGDVSSLSGITNVDGIVNFNNLNLGLYLVTQTNQVEGYSKINPFLVMIPQNQDNSWVYDVEATPKVDIIRLFDLTVEKIWNVSSNINIPKEVIIELFKGNEVIDTVTLNSENNWTYTWKQIEKSDEYSVKEKNVPTGYMATYRMEGNKFIVTNTKSLVQTGRSIWTIPILASLGLLFVGLGIALEKRKKYE